MNELTKLLKSVRTALDDGIHLTGGMIDESALPITDEEWQQVASAGSKRQREYACGRYHAHQLLTELGFTGLMIGRDDKGCPLWPDGIVGSISHTNNYCVAMLARKDHYTSLGVDMEETGRMHDSLWPRLFTNAEIDLLRKIDEPAEQQRQAAILFSAKEAFYKYNYPINGHAYKFTDVEVALNEDSRVLDLNVTDDAGDGQVVYQGCYASGMTHVMTVVYRSVD